MKPLERSREAVSADSPGRVLIVSNLYPPYVVGGAEIVASNLASWLAASGVDVTVVSTCGPDRGESSETVGGVRVLRYFPPNLWWNFERFHPQDRRTFHAKARWNLRDIWNRESAQRFGRILDELKPDIVHTHNLKGFSPAIWGAAARRRIPLVHTAHDYYLVCQRGTMSRADGSACARRCAGCLLPALAVKALAPQADVLTSPSRWVLDRYLHFGVRGKARSLVAPNGVNGTAGASIRRFRAGSEETLHLLFLGQLRREKGAHLLAPALSLLQCRWRLSVAGEGALSPSIAEWAARDRRVTWHGFVGGERKERLLAEAHALVFPSLWSENAPLVLAEAMRQGLPVLAGDLGAIPEFVKHEENGLLFPPGGVAAMAHAMTRLVNEEGLLERLSAGAAQSAAAWTIARMGQRYLDIYRELRRPGPGAGSVKAAEAFV